MAKLLENQQLGCLSLRNISPFDNKALIMDGLEKLAGLGVKEAQMALARVYVFNQLGGPEPHAFKLDFSIEERINGLGWLAEHDHAWSQHQLGIVYTYNKIGSDPCNMSIEIRKKSLEKISEIEGKHSLHVTQIFWENAIGEISLSFPEQVRIEQLYVRARAGDKHSLNYLLQMCTSNWLGENEKTRVYLGWSKEQRLQEIEKLKAIDPGYVETTVLDWIVKNCIGEENESILLNLSIAERHDLLQKAAFEKKNYRAGVILSDVYLNNRLTLQEGDELGMPLIKRIQLLNELAKLGIREAVRTTGQFYPEEGENIPPMTPRSLILSLCDVTLQGKHYDLGKENLALLFKSPFKETLQLLFSTLEASKYI